jgi:asparagine synthase (glutamine-hydrolysing)
VGPADEEDSNGRLVGRFHGEAAARQIDVLTDMFGGFETLNERNENIEAASRVPNRTNQQRVLQSLDLLNSNLRGLLHRNDTMGMASSIESRFPYLDSELISLGINLGANTKIRRVLYPADRRHPLYVDKWVLRKVAGRYLPKGLYQRPKRYFATTAYQRMQVKGDLFHDSYLSEIFGLSDSESDYLLERADERLTSKLVHLNVWGEVLIRGSDTDNIVSRLHDNISFRPGH